MSIIPTFTIVGLMFMLCLGFIACVILLKAVTGGGSRATKETAAKETEMIQEMYHGFRKMEKRIESLETLLLDDESARRAKFDDNLRKG